MFISLLELLYINYENQFVIPNFKNKLYKKKSAYYRSKHLKSNSIRVNPTKYLFILVTIPAVLLPVIVDNSLQDCLGR